MRDKPSTLFRIWGQGGPLFLRRYPWKRVGLTQLNCSIFNAIPMSENRLAQVGMSTRSRRRHRDRITAGILIRRLKAKMMDWRNQVAVVTGGAHNAAAVPRNRLGYHRKATKALFISGDQRHV